MFGVTECFYRLPGFPPGFYGVQGGGLFADITEFLRGTGRPNDPRFRRVFREAFRVAILKKVGEGASFHEGINFVGYLPRRGA